MRGSSRISTTGRSIARPFLPSGRTPATSVGASENRRIRPPASPPSDRSGRSARSAHKPRPADRPMRRRSLPIPVRRPGRPQAACPATFRPARRKTRPHGQRGISVRQTDLGPAGQRKDAFADADIRRLGNDIDRPDPLEMPAAAHQRGGSPYPNPFFHNRATFGRPSAGPAAYRPFSDAFPVLPAKFRAYRSDAGTNPENLCEPEPENIPPPGRTNRGKPCGRSARLSGTQRPASRVRYRPAGAVAALSAANMCLP